MACSFRFKLTFADTVGVVNLDKNNTEVTHQ
jgi:hypothetical protein